MEEEVRSSDRKQCLASVVAVARLIASTGFGVLWFTIGRVDAILIVAGALAVAIPAVVIILRPLITLAKTA